MYFTVLKLLNFFFVIHTSDFPLFSSHGTYKLVTKILLHTKRYFLLIWQNNKYPYMPWLGIEPTTFWYMGQCSELPGQGLLDDFLSYFIICSFVSWYEERKRRWWSTTLKIIAWFLKKLVKRLKLLKVSLTMDLK